MHHIHRTITTAALILAAAVGCGRTSEPTTAPASSATTSAASAAPTSGPTSTAAPSSAVTPQEQHTADGTTYPTPTSTADRRSAQPTGASGTPRGIPVTPVDVKDADAVASAFVTAAWSYDTAIDKTPSDAGRRAAVWATPGYAQALRSAQTKAQPGAWWNQMAAHNGYTTTQLSYGGLGPGPADTATTAQRAITVTATPHGDKGWKAAPLPSVTLIVTCTRASASAPWAVSDTKVVS